MLHSVDNIRFTCLFWKLRMTRPFSTVKIFHFSPSFSSICLKNILSRKIGVFHTTAWSFLLQRCIILQGNVKIVFIIFQSLCIYFKNNTILDLRECRSCWNWKEEIVSLDIRGPVGNLKCLLTCRSFYTSNEFRKLFTGKNNRKQYSSNRIVGNVVLGKNVLSAIAPIFFFCHIFFSKKLNYMKAEYRGAQTEAGIKGRRTKKE